MLVVEIDDGVTWETACTGNGPERADWHGGSDRTGGCPHTTARELELLAELGLRTSLHSDGDGAQRPVAELGEQDLPRETTRFVHAQGSATRSCGCLPTWAARCPSARDVDLKMGLGWPMTGRVLAAGLRSTLSAADVLRTDDLTVFPVTTRPPPLLATGHPGLVDTVSQSAARSKATAAGGHRPAGAQDPTG
ncbi:hypothetical protein [Streptomyces mirabilis]|uniref:hypothetical protein n=1 Tax=Streptomyces mirabilis TaxID=68239 RepID=UPI0036A82C5F